MNDALTKKTLLSLLPSVEGWLSEHEALLLYELAKSIPTHGDIVEIGSYKGRSTIALAFGLREGKYSGEIWAVDPHEGIIKTNQKSLHGDTLAIFKKNIRAASIDALVHPIVMTSKKAAKGWRKPIRLLFLDGLHDFEHTHEDYRLWSSRVKIGGCIAFHDAFCGEAGVWKVIRKYVFARKDIIDIGTSASILYVILGTPTFLSRLRVKRKKICILFAQRFHASSLPWTLKKIIIHKCIRLFLLTEYTWAIYKR